jgi:1-acyl-sn-glycerol-3-phosphate acyltransferase
VLAGIRYSERGRVNIPEGPVLIIANHQSAWETIAALVLFPDVAIVTKRELLALPVIGWFLTHSPMIPVDRAQSARALREMLAACRTQIAAGRSVLIFPEGTRKRPGSPIEFKRGVELLYRNLAIPTVIVAHDAGRHWRQGMRLHPGSIAVSILPPIPPATDHRVFVAQAQQLVTNEVANLNKASSARRIGTAYH